PTLFYPLSLHDALPILGAAHRLGGQVDAVGGFEFVEVPARQDLQHLRQRDATRRGRRRGGDGPAAVVEDDRLALADLVGGQLGRDRKSTRLNSSHVKIS